jgi:hypothetical protein
MQNSFFRSPDEHAMVEAARQRAQLAYAELSAVVHEAHRINVDLLRKGMQPFVVGQFNPPTATPGATGTDELIRVFDGQASWFASESAQLKHRLAQVREQLEIVNRPPAPLAPAPRRVPFAMAFAEITRVPWTWLRLLLFPPFAMLAGVPLALLYNANPLAGTLTIHLALAALWAVGMRIGLKRTRLLGRGDVATILQRTENTTATRNRNVPMLRARGWNISVEAHTGRTHKTDLVVQSPRGVTSKLTVRHGPAFDGVVLVDAETGYACANIDLGACPQPDATGQWTGVLSTRTWLTSLGALVLTVAIALGPVLFQLRYSSVL